MANADMPETSIDLDSLKLSLATSSVKRRLSQLSALEESLKRIGIFISLPPVATTHGKHV